MPPASEGRDMVGRPEKTLLTVHSATDRPTDRPTGGTGRPLPSDVRPSLRVCVVTRPVRHNLRRIIQPTTPTCTLVLRDTDRIRLDSNTALAAIPGSTGSSRRSRPTRPADTAFCRHQSPCGAFRQALYRR